MPMYEYRCDACGDVFEVIQKFSDPPLTVHEGCGGAVNRLLSAPALQFKGSGWYVTDYAHKNGSNTSPSKDASSGEGSKPAGDKAETKSKTESAPSSTPAPSPAKSDAK